MIEVGATVGGYRVERLLGRGGMGVVYEATQVSLDRRVALKVLRPELAADSAFVDRIRREGRVQAALEHPHVLDVYEVGDAGDELFLTMRLIDGPTLADLLRAGSLDLGRALNLLDQVAGALDAAHEAGLLHRDVKPQNVLVGGDDAFLTDFGLSRAATDTATASRPTLGTVAYIAPEVIRGEEPTPASDRYSFAATLFHCITGDVVFPRGSDIAVIYAHTSEPPPRVSERRPGLPTALDQPIQAALAKDPAERPANAKALMASVRGAIGDPEAADLAAPAPSAAGPAPAAAAQARTGPSRRRWIAALVATGIGAAALGAGAAALSDDGDGRPEVPVPAVAKGAKVIGSDLGSPDRSLGCGGDRTRGRAVACSIVQTRSAGAQLIAPADGTIVGWSVRGAQGEMALDVIRPGGEDTIRVNRSQFETADNAAPHRFRADMAVERGDQIGIQLAPGARIGVREADGATTRRWFDVVGGFYGSPDRGARTGFDYEMLVRAEFVAGRKQAVPPKLKGAAAERAPDGKLRLRKRVPIASPRGSVTAEVREVGQRVVIDLVRDGKRVQRQFLPDLRPGGDPATIDALPVEGEPYGGVDLRWVNPNSGRLIFHGLTMSRTEIQYIV